MRIFQFKKARPVWAQDRAMEKNCELAFRTVLPRGSYKLFLAASSIYRIWVNGVFTAAGPARAPHGHYRVDEYSLEGFLSKEENVIGIEVATIFSALGSRVTLLEKKGRLLDTMDPMISEQLEESLRSKGIDVKCNVSVMEIRSRGGDSVAVSYREEGPWKELAVVRILLSVGCRPDLSKVL